MTVIYVSAHSCQPKAREKKPDKYYVENVLHIRSTISPGQLRVDTIQEALLSGKDGQEIMDIAVQYCDKRHIQYIRHKFQQTTRPGESDIEAVRVLKEDFSK